MRKAILLGLFAVAAATGASAREFRDYQLLDINGSPLCEELLLDQHKTGLAQGALVGSCSLKDGIGGLYGGVRKVSGGPSWTVVFRETVFDADTQFIVVLNEKDLTWTAFQQKNGVSTYAFLTEGTLRDNTTPPPRRGGSRPLSSLLREARPAKAPAQSVEVHYTFAQPDGTPYCDGLTLTQSVKVAVGTHTGSNGCSEGTYAGGNYGHVKAVGDKVWTIVTTSAEFPGLDEMVVLDENAMTWAAFAQSGGIFQQVNAGILLDGDPGDAPGRKAARPALAAPPK